MQFPVPQFTDVEDRLIANLTIKQFGILFGAGVVIFLGYSASKSLPVVIFLGVLFGIPALVVAFARINGRSLYSTFPMVIRFIISPKFFVFRKEASANKPVKAIKALSEKKEVLESADTKRGRLQELQLKLEQSVSGKEALFNSKIKNKQKV